MSLLSRREMSELQAPVLYDGGNIITVHRVVHHVIDYDEAEDHPLFVFSFLLTSLLTLASGVLIGLSVGLGP